MKINITRTFFYTILMGIFLSGNSYGENIPNPIPIDLGDYNETTSDRAICDSCNINYTCEWFEENTSVYYEYCLNESCEAPLGALCCDEVNEILNCYDLENFYNLIITKNVLKHHL